MWFILEGVLRWAVLSALYIAFCGQLSPAEIIAAVLVGGGAAALSLLLQRAAERKLRLCAPWVRLIPRVVVAVLRDSARVALFLGAAVVDRTGGTAVRQRTSAFASDPAGAGRKALVLLLASAAPNGFVVTAGRRDLDIHRLAPAPPSPDTDWPL